MMRRLLLSSAKPHQPHHHHHHHNQHHHHHHHYQQDDQRNKSNRSPDTERQRRLYSAAKVSPNTPVRSAAHQQQVQRKQSYRVSKGGIIRRGRSLARTRSESDLIRAMAKSKADKKKAFSSDFSDDESDDDSSSSEDESQRATSLRSFTKEDEERYALASWNNAFPGEVCSKIEEDEQSATIKSVSLHEQEAEDATENNPTPTCSGSSSTKLTAVSPLSDPSEVSVQQQQQHQQPELKTANLPSTLSSLKDEETKTHLGSESGNESTSATTELVGSEVDVEYLLHENDLLKTSLEHVTQDRDYLAQDNWNLRMELENLRNQMRFLMTPSVSQYNARVMYPAGASPPSYTTDASMSMNHHRLSQQDCYGGTYTQYGGPLCTQSFEDLMHETAR